MSTVLMYTSPARGHLYPMMDVALELKAAGHRVVVQTLADEQGPVEAVGLEHRSISPAIEAITMDDYQGATLLARLTAALACWQARAPHEVADIETAYEEVRPDLLLVDANTWGAAAFAEAQRRPWVMFLPYALPVPSRDTPAFGPGFKPPRNGLERLRDRIVWSVQKLPMRSSIQGLNRLRGELGVDPVGSLSDVYLRADILLYRTAEPFDYARSEWPAGVHPIGPGLWAPPGEVPAWLHDLPHPRVLVSVSTELQEDGAIVETALEALADEPGGVIVTTAALDPEQFSSANDRVHISQFVPHAQVIPHVDVVVTHGGMGSTQRALAAGVPVCVVPWGRDQLETARRAENSGAGVMVPRSKLGPDRLRSAVHEALTLDAAADHVARRFHEAGGGARGAELVEGLLHRTAPAPASAD